MTTNNDYYFDKNTLAINQEGKGIKIHPMVGLLISPIIGLAFLMFLPLIGFVLAFKALGMKIMKIARPLFDSAVGPVSVPGSAHLTGTEPKENKNPENDLDQLAKEVKARRGE